MGSGAILGVAPAPEYTFLIYVSPVGNYFKVLFYASFFLVSEIGIELLGFLLLFVFPSAH